MAWLASFSTDTMLGNTGNLGGSGSGASATLVLLLLNSSSGSVALLAGYARAGELSSTCEHRRSKTGHVRTLSPPVDGTGA